jgi:hypothetical protein
VDGHRISYLSSDLLKGIKRIERNPAVMGQVLMWAAYLKDPWDLYTEPYPFLGFGELIQFDLDNGIDDSLWLGSEDADEISVIESSNNQLTLFDEETDNL